MKLRTIWLRHPGTLEVMVRQYYSKNKLHIDFHVD